MSPLPLWRDAATIAVLEDSLGPRRGMTARRSARSRRSSASPPGLAASRFQASPPGRAARGGGRRVSEALIETAFGLAVAIPSVLGFNYLNGLVVREETMLNNAAGELLDLAETWTEQEIEHAPVERSRVLASIPGGRDGVMERAHAAMEPA